VPTDLDRFVTPREACAVAGLFRRTCDEFVAGRFLDANPVVDALHQLNVSVFFARFGGSDRRRPAAPKGASG
jgi:hypothetical protein